MDRRGHQTFRAHRYGHGRRQDEEELRAARVNPAQKEVGRGFESESSLYSSGRKPEQLRQQPLSFQRNQQTKATSEQALQQPHQGAEGRPVSRHGESPAENESSHARSLSGPQQPETPISKRVRGLDDPFTTSDPRATKSPRKDETPRSGAGISIAQLNLHKVTGDESPGGFSPVSKQNAAVEAKQMTDEIVAILKKHDTVVSDAAREELESMAVLNARRVQGYIKGRDFVRSELQKKDLEIQRLIKQKRELEESLQMHKVSSDILLNRAKQLEEYNKTQEKNGSGA